MSTHTHIHTHIFLVDVSVDELVLLLVIKLLPMLLQEAALQAGKLLICSGVGVGGGGTEEPKKRIESCKLI